jgi:hypothetical protein
MQPNTIDKENFQTTTELCLTSKLETNEGKEPLWSLKKHVSSTLTRP